MRDVKNISFFILALLIAFINRAYLYFPDISVDWFIFANFSQDIGYYFYDNSNSVIVILLSLFIYKISEDYYIKKTALFVTMYFIVNIMSYFLYRETVGSVGIVIPFIDYKIGFFHLFVVHLILYHIYYFYLKNNNHE